MYSDTKKVVDVTQSKATKFSIERVMAM